MESKIYIEICNVCGEKNRHIILLRFILKEISLNETRLCQLWRLYYAQLCFACSQTSVQLQSSVNHHSRFNTKYIFVGNIIM